METGPPTYKLSTYTHIHARTHAYTIKDRRTHVGAHARKTRYTRALLLGISIYNTTTTWSKRYLHVQSR